MAEIKQIKVGNEVLTLKDSNSRNDIATINSNITSLQSGKINKSDIVTSYESTATDKVASAKTANDLYLLINSKTATYDSEKEELSI